jgi:type I restriction enzyme S subunit
MSRELKPYDEYKSAKQEWLGKIPSHWKQAKSKRTFMEVSIKGYPEEELLSATQKHGVIPRSKLNTRVVMPTGNLETFKLVKEDNFVISLRSFQGGLEYSRYRGIVSPAYTVLEMKSLQSHIYYKYLFKSHAFIQELQRNITGIREGKNIDINNFKEIVLPIPSHSEQDQIVKYLDFKLAKINKFIKSKKKLIKVLNEQKQAVINEAVTKGTNPNVKMKPSGVEWIGDIPEHWEIKRIKNTAKILRGKFNHRPRNDERLYGGDYPFIQTGDVARANKYIVSYKQTLNEQGYSVSKEFPKGTLTMTIAANIGDVSILDFKACFPDSIVGFIPQNNMDLEYIYYVFYSMKQEFLKEAPVNTQGNLNIERVGAMCIGIPPFDEQKIIKRWIEDRTTAIDKSIEGIEREISLITEFRTCLISDVVTGRVDVRGIEIGDIVEDETDNFDEVDIDDMNDEEVDNFEESEV